MELVCGASRNSAGLGGIRWSSAAPATWNFHLQFCRPLQFMPTLFLDSVAAVITISNMKTSFLRPSPNHALFQPASEAPANPKPLYQTRVVK